MLVLTRKSDQSIIIGDDIEITVLEVRGEQVRLGIRAPRTVEVHRKEVFQQIHGITAGINTCATEPETEPASSAPLENDSATCSCHNESDQHDAKVVAATAA